MSARQVLSAVRGEPRRLGNLRHLLALLRPYRGRVVLMMIALVLATAAALAPPYLAGLAIESHGHHEDRSPSWAAGRRDSRNSLVTVWRTATK